MYHRQISVSFTFCIPSLGTFPEIQNDYFWDAVSSMWTQTYRLVKNLFQFTLESFYLRGSGFFIFYLW